MIKFEHTEVMNFAGAFRGMRNAFESWDKADSAIVVEYDSNGEPIISFDIGKNDLALAQKLINAGSDHRKFMRQILVSVDITAPLYWWKEFDTYKVGTVANSCSTMHTIHKRDITMTDFSFDKLMLNADMIDYNGTPADPKRLLLHTITMLNLYRKFYLETKDKKYWWQIIQLLPTSYNQKRTLTLSYETLHNIYGARRNHKLDEWSVGFMEWIDSLPYAEELIKYGG